MPKPEDFDFPCSQTWREYYNSRFGDGNMIDFAVSPDWARHYQGLGMMPTPPMRRRERERYGKRPSTREWQRIGEILAKAQSAKPKPRKPRENKLRGVLR